MAQAAQRRNDWTTKLSERKRHYETIFIISPSIDDAKLKEITEKLDRVASESEIQFLRKDNWGKLRMAYDIEKHATGNYFYYRYIGSNNSVKALERTLKLDASCLRYQTILLSEDLTSDEIETLVQKAPTEASISPTDRAEDEVADFN